MSISSCKTELDCTAKIRPVGEGGNICLISVSPRKIPCNHIRMSRDKNMHVVFHTITSTNTVMAQFGQRPSFFIKSSIHSFETGCDLGTL